MADFPQQHEVHFPANASRAEDTPRNVVPPHPQSAPSYYPLPAPGQLHDYAGVVPDGEVSIGVAMIFHSRKKGSYALCNFSSHRRMLLVTFEQTMTERTITHL